MSKVNIFESNWVNMVFEGRNHAYGAYVLRKKSSEYTLKGIVFAIVGFTLAVSAPVIVNYIKASLPKEKVVTIDDPNKLKEPPPMDKSQPPPPPPPPPPPLKSTVKFTPPEIKPDEEVPDETPPTQEKLQEVEAGTQTVEGDPNAKEVLEEPAGDGDGNEILMSAEVEPKFNGDLYKYLGEHIEYPPVAKEAGVVGKVVLKFAVGKDGSISEITVMKSLGFGCDEAAIKVVKNMPKWSPGLQNGRPVNVWFILPFDFNLGEEE